MTVADELKLICEQLPEHLEYPSVHTKDDFEIISFEQRWENTSGGFEGCGGDMLTTQTTHVFIPLVEDENYLIWFGTRFAYSVAQEDAFLLRKDIENKCVAGMKHYIKRYC